MNAILQKDIHDELFEFLENNSRGIAPTDSIQSQAKRLTEKIMQHVLSQRRLYDFDADGIALGSRISVVAESVNEAYELARKWCDDNSVNRESLKVRRSVPFSGSMVVYGWNGDY